MDGNDVLAVKKATEQAVERARKGEGPTFIENKTYRIRGHFEGDPQKYRTVDEVEKWQKNNDPIDRFSKYIVKKKKSNQKSIEKIRDEVAAELQETFDLAIDGSFPEPKKALEDLFVNDKEVSPS